MSGMQTLVAAATPARPPHRPNRLLSWWATLSMISGAAFAALFALTTLGFAQYPHLAGAAGLLQRLTVGVGWLWLTLVAARDPRRPRKSLHRASSNAVKAEHTVQFA